jgi:hypothetical protein
MKVLDALLVPEQFVIVHIPWGTNDSIPFVPQPNQLGAGAYESLLPYRHCSVRLKISSLSPFDVTCLRYQPDTKAVDLVRRFAAEQYHHPH